MITNFLNKITGFEVYGDAYLEVVTDYTSSKYFTSDEVAAATQYATNMAKAGHEVHYGPAARKENLGSRRSDRTNVLWVKSCWVDIDSPDKTLSADDKLKVAEKLKNDFLESLKVYNLEPSFIVCSGHGYHIYFILKRVHMNPSEWSKIQNALILMAKGDQQAKDAGRLLRVPGTQNWKDKNKPRQVELIYESDRIYDEKDFTQLVRDYTGRDTPAGTQAEGKPLGFIPPCIAHLVDPNTSVDLGHRHQVRLTVATFGFHEGWTAEDTIEKLKHVTDDQKKNENDIRGVYKVLERDPERYSVGCGEGSNLKALVDNGVTVCDKAACKFMNPPAQDNQAPDKETILQARFDGLIDLVLDDKNKVVFLVKENGDLVLKDKYEVDNQILVPPPITSIQWLLPRAKEVVNHYNNDNDRAIFDDLVTYHANVSELPDANHYKFLAAYDMHTHLADKCDYSPIVWFYAIPERGKTRTGRAILYVARRGLQVITVREAHLIRMAQDLGATLFIDISDLQRKMEAAGAEDILLNRYERGAKVARVLYPDKGPFKDTMYYEVYGSTVVATNEMVNETLATRAIQIIMPQSDRNFDADLKESDGIPYRERLVAFRARWYDKDLPNVLKPCKGRLGDILRPVRQMVNIVGDQEDWFLEFTETIEKQKKLSGADTLDARVVMAINEARMSIKRGHLLHDDILAMLNRNTPERERITAIKLGKITSRLGFDKYTSGQQRGIYFNQALFLRLCSRFGIDTPHTFDDLLNVTF